MMHALAHLEACEPLDVVMFNALNFASDAGSARRPKKSQPKTCFRQQCMQKGTNSSGFLLFSVHFVACSLEQLRFARWTTPEPDSLWRTFSDPPRLIDRVE